MAVLKKNRVRNATIRCQTDCSLYSLHADDLQECLMLAHPAIQTGVLAACRHLYSVKAGDMVDTVEVDSSRGEELLQRAKNRAVAALGGVDPLTSQDNDLLGSRACMCLQPDNGLRKAALATARNVWFERTVLAAIVASSIVLAMEDVSRKSNPDWQLIFLAADLLFFIIFGLEFITKVIAMGFAFKHHAYLRDPWNWYVFPLLFIRLL